MEKNQQIKFADLKPVEIAENERVKNQFVKLLTTIHHMPEADAETVYERESMYYKKAITESAKLQGCDNISLYSAFLEIAITGLSIQPGGKSEAFLESRSVKSGKKDPETKKDIYINNARLVISAYGELNMRIRSGQIVRMSNPIVLYDGDHFQPHTTPRGELTIDYRPAIPRKSNTIIGCYVCITLPNNGIDFKWLLNDDIERLKKYSAKANKKWDDEKRCYVEGDPSALYSGNTGQIDPGFLEAKTIKHAMRSYTKLRVSDSVSFEDDIPTVEVEDTFAEPAASAQEQPGTVTINDNSDIF